jgi:membrane protease YdiL (CAAX protease family)
MSKRMNSATNPLQAISLEKPILTGLVLLIVAFCLKLVDIFVLRLDELLGEIILSKWLGFVLVVAFTWAAGRKLKDMGLHSRLLGQSLTIGALITAIAFAVGYGVDYAIQLQSGAQPVFHLAAIDPKAGVSGGLLFAVWMVIGNFVNSFMEEGLFRGVMIPLFRVRLTFWQANWLQAFLFSIWHLVWVVKWYQTGMVETPEEILFGVFSNSVPQLLMGLVWGYMYLKTGSLWPSWIGHLLTNTVANSVHITTVDGMDTGFGVRMLLYTITALLGMLLVKHLAERFRMPEVKPWGARANS